MGQVITFYSFKGGVGRTMALANIALLLTRWDKNVLVVDWDLEAPGLEHYFSDFIDPSTIANRVGVLDLLSEAAKEGGSASIDAWRLAPLRIPLNEGAGTLDLLGSGNRDANYFSRLRSLDIDHFYTVQGGGIMMERVRDWWKEQYDYVLLDSRTGITDIGGICTIHLPDMLVLLFTATDQSLDGVIDVARKAAEQRQKLPFDRLSLNCLPIASRFDTSTELEISQHWLDRFAKKLDPICREWLPVDVDTRKFLESSKIPYIAYFSFGEKLAVREQGTTDSAGLGYAYESVAGLIGNDLAFADQLLRNRARYLRSAAESKPAITSHFESASELAVLLVESDRSTALGEMISPSEQDSWLLTIREQLSTIARDEGGEVLSSTDDSYIFRFLDIGRALKCGLAMQKQLAVNPVRRQGETAKARMGLYGIRGSDSETSMAVRDLFRTAAAISRNAKAGQLIVSESVRQRCVGETDWVRFEPAGTVETSPSAEGQQVLETYEAIAIKKVKLNGEELELLFEQDPGSRNAGGFQNFLVKLQEKTNRSTGELELTLSDLERIARLAFDYRHGGWQNQLRRIFGRVLGEALGRDAQI
jgi:MinD-like ATPase involved in chromosome partitioning or flagellar assembly/class 3 adenylate cyclase